MSALEPGIGQQLLLLRDDMQPCSSTPKQRVVSHLNDGRPHPPRAAIKRVARAPRYRPDPGAITIRPAVADDARALATLAQLDSAKVPPGPILLALVGGRARAAISLRDGSTIADPFERTAAIVELLSVRAAHLRAERPSRARRVRRLLAWARA
jgi:hypothetical protein